MITLYFQKETVFADCDGIPVAIVRDIGSPLYNNMAYDTQPPRCVTGQFLESEGVRISASQFLALVNRYFPAQFA